MLKTVLIYYLIFSLYIKMSLEVILMLIAVFYHY